MPMPWIFLYIFLILLFLSFIVYVSFFYLDKDTSVSRVSTMSLKMTW